MSKRKKKETMKVREQQLVSECIQEWPHTERGIARYEEYHFTLASLRKCNPVELAVGAIALYNHMGLTEEGLYQLLSGALCIVFNPMATLTEREGQLRSYFDRLSYFFPEWYAIVSGPESFTLADYMDYKKEKKEEDDKDCD